MYSKTCENIFIALLKQNVIFIATLSTYIVRTRHFTWIVHDIPYAQMCHFVYIAYVFCVNLRSIYLHFRQESQLFKKQTNKKSD